MDENNYKDLCGRIDNIEEELNILGDSFRSDIAVTDIDLRDEISVLQDRIEAQDCIIKELKEWIDREDSNKKRAFRLD